MILVPPGSFEAAFNISIKQLPRRHLVLGHRCLP